MQRCDDEPTGCAPRVVAVMVTHDPPAGVLERSVGAFESERGRIDPHVATVDPLCVLDAGGRAAERLATARLPDVEVVGGFGNPGFGAAANIGLRTGLDRGADVLVVLNDDVTVREGWLEPLLDELADERVGAVQPVLVRADDPDIVDGAGVGIDRYGQGTDLHRGAATTTVGVRRSDPARDVAAITGGAVAFAAGFLRDVGLFDGRFFLYYEDVELCRRAARRGWRRRVVPASRVEHVGSATTSSLGDRVRYLQERNRLWCVAMHGGAIDVVRAVGLSVRRLRHHPRSVHLRALLGAVPGMVTRSIGRAVPGRSTINAPATVAGPR